MNNTSRHPKFRRFAALATSGMIMLQFAGCGITPETTEGFFGRLAYGFAEGLFVSLLNQVELF
jgi:hypothetical protein